MSKRIVLPLIAACHHCNNGGISSSKFQKPFGEQFRFVSVEKGSVVMVINSTGTVQPSKSVQIRRVYLWLPIKRSESRFQPDERKENQGSCPDRSTIVRGDQSHAILANVARIAKPDFATRAGTL